MMVKKRRGSSAATKCVAVLDDQKILRGFKEVPIDAPGIEVPRDCDLLDQKGLFRFVETTGQFRPVREKAPAAEDAMIAIIDAIEAAGIAIAPVATDWRDFRKKRMSGGGA